MYIEEEELELELQLKKEYEHYRKRKAKLINLRKRKPKDRLDWFDKKALECFDSLLSFDNAPEGYQLFWIGE